MNDDTPVDDVVDPDASDDETQLLEFDPPLESVGALSADVTPAALTLGEPIVGAVTPAAQDGSSHDVDVSDVPRATIDCSLPDAVNGESNGVAIVMLHRWLVRQGFMKALPVPAHVYSRDTSRAVQRLQRHGDGYGGAIDGRWNERTRTWACTKWGDS